MNVKWIKFLVFLICLLPLLRLVLLGLFDGLGPNPVSHLIHSTGVWSLVLLLVTLSITPLRRLFEVSQILRLRRMFGQYAFFYGLLHFLIYAWFDQYFEWQGIWRDIMSRPFILVGFISLFFLVPMSVTSTNRWVQRLGVRWWRRIHWLIYPSAFLAVLHFWLEVKRDIREPLIYAILLGILFLYRIGYAFLCGRTKPLLNSNQDCAGVQR